MPDIDPKNKNRFSFHGSGEIHSPVHHNTTYRITNTTLSAQSKLFGIIFQDTEQIRRIQTKRKTDIEILTKVEKDDLVISSVYISPIEKMKLKPINSGKNNHLIILKYPAKDFGTLIIQIVFDTFSSSWKNDITYITWTANMEQKDN